MFGTIVKKYSSFVKYQQTYRELSRLSNRELNDLGIGRGDIANLARKASR
ncbi:DUF1127 domain-containing protein [Methylobrevis pamukkalensis]|uniref:YjiS-like domain-containing protein n=1 Tax=Methylobrevis pamukkalensis TaxID=1439726 RepID=A0A1E3H080_9HYPH|nr:DUF1127 domain-containing protein [Methylobrevis pamukkalensis]ODN69748.1 hypothetical protein A6302_02958 [Methylobrevis pamukkalensis]